MVGVTTIITDNVTLLAMTTPGVTALINYSWRTSEEMCLELVHSAICCLLQLLKDDNSTDMLILHKIRIKQVRDKIW